MVFVLGTSSPSASVTGRNLAEDQVHLTHVPSDVSTGKTFAGSEKLALMG